MSELLDHISRVNSSAIAIESAGELITYGELSKRIINLKIWLNEHQPNSVLLHADNSIDWVVVDIACQSLGIILTPVPTFFTDDQLNKVIHAVKPELILSDRKLQVISAAPYPISELNAYRVQAISNLHAPKKTSKITFTSGSTGDPKGVCLSEENQTVVARSLVDVIGLDAPRHLCLLPLPTLLENIAGVYAPLFACGTIIVPNEASRGFAGSKLASPEQLVRCISFTQPNTLILVPELLQLLVQACARGWHVPDSLKFVAVGGSKVSETLLKKARQAGIPVCQGYGLSECASVVSLCSLSDGTASCGEVLPHLEVEIINREIVVKGNTFLGYLDQQETWGIKQVQTGDVGKLVDGRLIIDGRIKNTMINSFGRNISPEWIESELLATGMFSQAVAIGDAKPFCSALLTPLTNTATKEQLQKAVDRVNKTLPDYAQILQPIFLSSLMTVEQGLYTENMRPKRTAIYQHFKSEIEHVYLETC